MSGITINTINDLTPASLRLEWPYSEPVSLFLSSEALSYCKAIFSISLKDFQVLNFGKNNFSARKTIQCVLHSTTMSSLSSQNLKGISLCIIPR